MGKAGIAVREEENGAAAPGFAITERDGFERRGKARIWEQRAPGGFRHNLDGLKVKTRPKS